jgi:mono/diheme cytochrome c family protein
MPRLLSVIVFLAAPLAAAQPPATHHGRAHGADAPGADVYRTHCAACHGAGGKGDGPLAESLRFHPPDLTLIASRHGGTYPTEDVHRIVDGRKPLRGHGGPDMPIWGDAFRGAETGYDDATAKERIRSVVDYVRTLQAPASK